MHHQPKAAIALRLQHKPLDTPTLLRFVVQPNLTRKITDLRSWQRQHPIPANAGLNPGNGLQSGIQLRISSDRDGSAERRFPPSQHRQRTGMGQQRSRQHETFGGKHLGALGVGQQPAT